MSSRAQKETRGKTSSGNSKVADSAEAQAMGESGGQDPKGWLEPYTMVWP